MGVTRRDALRWSLAGSFAGAMPWAAYGEEPKQVGSDDLVPGEAEPVCLTDFEPLARQRMTNMAYAYISGAAADEITLRWNREAFDRLPLKQRVLTDVSTIDTRTTLLGRELPYPVLLAPTAAHRLAHDQGELATARGAAAAGATMVLSSFSTVAVEDVAREAGGPPWFQLYVQPDRGFTRALIQRAEAAGCQALFVTVDTPVIGTRNREQRARFVLPEHLEFAHFRGLERPKTWDPALLYAPILEPRLTWKDIDWIRNAASVPVILKGITAPEDAAIAVRERVDGIVVSNHGARNLDTTPATITALPRVMDETQDRVPVLLDGGVRRGTDVLKALALGARAVLIGRPQLYGLAVAGAAGVSHVLEILLREFQMAMALTGCTSISRIGPSVLWAEA